jgi:hypothetical protein
MASMPIVVDRAEKFEKGVSAFSIVTPAARQD